MSSRLPSCRAVDVERALKRAGFSLHHTRGSHRYYWHPARHVMVTVPHHSRDLKRGTLLAIVKQAGLTVDEFTRLL